MKFATFTFLTGFLWSLPAIAHGPHNYGPTEERQTVVISSEFPNEDRKVLVRLPYGYSQQPDRSFPVLFLLDANREFVMSETVSAVETLVNRHKSPDMIVVALPSGTDEARARDYTPDQKADQFLDFLEHELIPHIESNYRAADCRILSGHSRSGLFSFYSMLMRPDLFSAYFALSPAFWHNDDSIVDDARLMFESEGYELDSFLYMNIGGGENENITNSFDRMKFVLRRHAPTKLDWQADYAEFESHGTTRPLGQYLGLRKFFLNWNVQNEVSAGNTCR